MLQALDHFTRRWYLLDRAAWAFESEYMLKGGVLTAFLWWGWFRPSLNRQRDRSILLSGALSSVATLVICRFLAYAVPFRQRPIFTESLHLHGAFGADVSDLLNWSSFPSDHAGLCFALVTTMFFVSFRAGMILAVYTTCLICLPRVYLGVHYPTDILVGALIGILTAWVFQRPGVRNLLARSPLKAVEHSPQGFYPALYIASLLLTTNFDFVRKCGALFFHSLRLHGKA